MRPITLTIDGLRSYRKPATLDFSNINLLAIVGDTGAGKSSILEAITYALYSAATWTGQPGELIADGVRTMKVALTFEADGKKWQVTRSMSRDGYPAPVHRLVCEAEGTVFNGRSDVNATIERLVGLDCKAFLQSVILPQGRFAELLKATPAERGKILQNIFRVDELIAARDTADRLLSRWGPRHESLVTARSLYLDDPTAAATEAAARRTDSESRKQVLDHLRKTLAQLQSTATEADRDAAQLDSLAAGLAEPALAGTADQLNRLATVAAELAMSRTTLDEARQEARQHEKNALDRLQHAAREGTGLTDLAKAEAELEALERELDDIADATNQAASNTTELEAFRQRSREQQAAAEAATKKAEETRTVTADATQSAAEAIRARDAAREALATYRNKAEHGSSLAEELQQCRDDLDAHRATAERLAENAVDATTQAEEAEQRVRELEKSAAAAAASHDCSAGDPCPVCDRELPETWRPPIAPKLDTARRERDQTVQARDKARTEAATAAGQHTATIAREQERRAALDAAERATAHAFARLAELSLLTNAQVKTKIADDDAVLAKVESVAAKADAERDHAVANAAEQRDIATRASADAEAVSKDVADRERSIRSSMDTLTKKCVGLRSRAAKLPEVVRPDIALDAALDLSLTIEERSVALGTSRVADALEAARASLSDLRDVEAAGATARANREQLDEELDALDARWARDVAEPTAAAARRTEKLANRLADVLTRLEQSAEPPRPSTDDAAALSRWAATIEKSAEATTKSLAKRANIRRDRAAEARKQVSDSLAESGIDDVEALDSAIVEVATAAQIAATDERTARAQIAVVAQLDDRIKRGGDFLADLRAVHELLGNSRYIGFLMHRRQQALLGVATNLLGEMSAGRFGFSEHFEVIDCYSGQPRSTSTLSGGESFLASMALALAMVELAGRAGGRLDSLFLDEGFGSLDAKTLDIAIDTLEGRAKAGRLVAIISHVKTVAERIEDVLAVIYNTSDGSSFGMLTAAERTGLVRDDATDAIAGLLA